MSDALAGTLTHWHQKLAVAPCRLLSVLVAFFLGGLIMWNPETFAARIGGFNVFNAIAIIWATCAAIIHAVGFMPRRWWFQILFMPAFSWLIALYFAMVWFS